MERNNKSGFSLVELMITLVIASFLIMTMNTVLQQTSRSRNFVDSCVRDSLHIGTLYEVLIYDFSGITMAYAIEESEKNEKEIEKEIIPPIQITRGADNVIQEIRFFSINAREYKKHYAPTEIIYTLTLTNKTKKTYTLTRTVILKESSSQRKEFTIPPVALMNNITQCSIQFVKQKSKDEKKKDDVTPFVLFDKWPLKEKTEEKNESKQNVKIKESTQPKEKTNEQKKEKKELEDISYVQLTFAYIKNERGAIESITFLIPLFLNKQAQISEKKEPEKKKQPAQQNEQQKKVAKKKKIKEKNKEELARIEERTNSMLNLIFKGVGTS